MLKYVVFLGLAVASTVASAQSCTTIPPYLGYWLMQPAAPPMWWFVQVDAQDAQAAAASAKSQATMRIGVATAAKNMLLASRPGADTTAGDTRLLQSMSALAQAVTASDSAKLKYDWAVTFAMFCDVANAVIYFNSAAVDWDLATEFAELAGGLAGDAADEYR